MTMYIGNQTAFFTTDPEEPFEYALEHSFTAFEWFSDKKYYDNGNSSGWGYSDVTSERAEELKAISLEQNIRFSVHASWIATPLTHDGMKDIFAAVSLADKIGAKLVNIHLDVTGGIPEFAKALIPVILATETRGLLLAVENTPMHSPEHFNEFFDALEKLQVDSIENVGMCLDIGHANCCEATRNDYIGFIDRLNTNVKINHCHIHENWGDSDSHLALFTASSAENDSGIRLFLERMKTREFSGSLIMEQWPAERDVLDTIYVRLCEMLGIEIQQNSYVAKLDALTPDDTTLTEDINTSSVVVPETTVRQSDNDYSSQGRDSFVMVENDTAGESWALQEIIKFSLTNKSWRRRLEAVKELFFADKELLLADLAAIAVYLRFLATAEIPCVEDGGHYRPCHHAKAAMEIEEAVAKVTNNSNSWIMRKIYPYLPSHAEEFMRHEPLTRIRDIAHRNDIPKDIKLDIKHNLQNKLHRSAGPEDLLTAERILRAITADGAQYSQHFVNEFKIFYNELKEFFNALGLEKRLGIIKQEFTELSSVVDDFIKIKECDDPVKKARAALVLREEFKKLLSNESAAEKTQLRLADIELEDYAFVTISESINIYKDKADINATAFEIIIVALKHIYLGEFDSGEAACLLSEFTAWEKDVLGGGNRLAQLRLWSTVQRSIRFCSHYADIVNEVFSGAVIELGSAFKIPRHAVDVYCEGDIRANLIFQLSRILGRVQKALIAELELSPWSVVNGGSVKGQVVVAGSLGEFEERQGEYIVLLEHAEGDEEIPSSVKAILLAHPIAHLSHLGVRSRSGMIPFAAAEDNAAFGMLREEYVGRELALKFDENGIGECTDYQSIESDEVISSIVIPEIILSSEIVALNAESISSESCGAKAGASAELFLAADRLEGFIAPKVVAIPYGVMELCFETNVDVYAEYKTLIAELGSIDHACLDEHLESISALIFKISLPQELLVDIAECFGENVGLAVRSSSSGEDLVGFAGAGLYDSVIGVGLDDLEDAIKQVWASKWTRRAVLSRDKYGVAHSDVYMGVLIQEMVEAEYSFVLHTANPITGESDEVGMELAVGFGETLASANQAGSPCRMKCHCDTGEVVVERCADISNALVYSVLGGGLDAVKVDYSTITEFLGDKLYDIAGDLHIIGKRLEKHFKIAQDIEGAFAGGKYYIVQSRAQAGIDRG